MSKLAYSGISTKIKAMSGRLLREKEYREISELTSIPELIAYLKNNESYAPLFENVNEHELHRTDIEKILSNSLYNDFSRLYKFADMKQKQFLELYFLRYEVAIIKECLCSIFDNSPESIHLDSFYDFFTTHSNIDVLQLAAATTIPELAEGLKNSGLYPIFTRLSQLPDSTLIDYETHLDLYYFSQFWKIRKKFLSGPDLEAVTKIYGYKIDLLNIQWITRAKKNLHLTPTDIYPIIIPIQYKLKKKEFTALIEAETLEEMSAIISSSYYGKGHYNIDVNNVEDTYLRLQHKINDMSANKYPYSVAILNSYLYKKERERNRLITAIECIRYNMDASTTFAYITR